MIIKPDLLITWHESCDYPVFRATLEKHRDSFGKIIIYFSKHFREPVYRDFLKNSMQDLGNIVLLDPIEYKYGEEDWRNISTNYMLQFTDSEWICSVEQDWFAKDWTNLLSKTEDAMHRSDLVGWMSGTRFPYIHPSYWFMRRSFLERTNKDFAAHPEIYGSDHFAMITYDAQEKEGRVITLEDMGIEANIKTPEETACFHQGGINQNYLTYDQDNWEKALHRKELFYIYNYWSMKADVPQDPRFMELMTRVDDRLKKVFPDIDPETSKWKEFYV